MQELHSPGIQAGDLVLIDWPRTRWDHRRGQVQEIRMERGHTPQAFVQLDGMAVLFPMQHLRRA